MSDFYDYWSLEKVEWDNGAGIEDLIIYGINSIKTASDLIDDMAGRTEISSHELINLNFLIRNMLENMERCIYRLKEEARQTDTTESTETGNVEKPKNTFEDDRFLEYVSQIKIDGHDPADILETWLKENKPEYFNEDTESKT